MLLRLFSKIKVYLAIAGAVIVAIIGAYLRGRKDQKALGTVDTLNQYIETRRQIDEAPNDISDAGGAREWLLNRQRKQ